MIDMGMLFDHVKTNKPFKISKSEYDTWHKNALVDALRGKKLAESFCDRYDLVDYILLYTTKNVEKYILKHYVK